MLPRCVGVAGSYLYPMDRSKAICSFETQWWYAQFKDKLREELEDEHETGVPVSTEGSLF